MTSANDDCQYDLFISHASEDKFDCVEPLVAALTNAGLSVWYDRFTLRLGDSLTGKKLTRACASLDSGSLFCRMHSSQSDGQGENLMGLPPSKTAVGGSGFFPSGTRLSRAT